MRGDYTMVPLDFISTKRIQPGETIRVNVSDIDNRKTVTRIFKVMTVDRVNGIASCVWVADQTIKV